MYLEQARKEQDAIRMMTRALELGQPVQVSFRSATHSITTLCPSKGSEKLLAKLGQQAFDRVVNLEKQEVYWCQEVAFLARQRALNVELRMNPEKSLNDIRAEEAEQDEVRKRSNPDYVAPTAAATQ